MPRKASSVFSCTECGSQSPKWIGRCPDCNAWNSYGEERASTAASASSSETGSISIGSVGEECGTRTLIGLPGLDRVLGGGLVPGGVTLVGGEPGVGKSTLLLQAAHRLAHQGIVLYVSGEESPRQIAMRARRLGTAHDGIHLFAETGVERIIAELEHLRPVACIVDSIQTVHVAANSSAPGSIGQVRDSAGMLMTAAKRLGIPLFLIGHITKDGSIAGPKSLEHIVDTVLYFEGERVQNYRVVRACKNRFGPVNEVAIFQMHDNGLEDVPNPSAVLLEQRSTAAGSAVLAAVEGTRPLLVEVQALVSPTHFPSPRRTAMGIDSSRLSLLLAVLERHAGGNYSGADVFVNIAGGLQIAEPALDLGILAAVLSSQRNRPLPNDLAVFGEAGLLGEIRSVSQPDLRAREAAALGFRRLLVPRANAGAIRADIEVLPVRGVAELSALIFT